ncbi:MAG: glycosyltransferase family 4 protein [Rhodoplanes sp.]
MVAAISGESIFRRSGNRFAAENATTKGEPERIPVPPELNSLQSIQFSQHPTAVTPFMPKLLYVVTEDWFFVSHFLPMARAAKAAGFEVVVATRIRQHGDAIAREGLRVLPLQAERASLDPLKLVHAFLLLVRIMRTERPDVVHCIALKSIVLGGLAARLVGTKAIVLAPTGLGELWIGDGVRYRLLRMLVRALMRGFLQAPQVHYLFENREDPCEFGLDPNGPLVTILGGAGVDPDRFSVAPEPPAPPVKIAVIARMIAPKGIAEAVEATRLARAAGAPVELHLFGDPDSSNWRSIPQEVLAKWSAEPGISWHGRTDDVAKIWREHHIAMLLSHREGLPRTLLEAAACGRPIVATDVTGCREVVRDGVEGLLTPLRDPAAAARAIARLAHDPGLRRRLGLNGRARVEERFTEAAVMRAVGAVYTSYGGGAPTEGRAPRPYG